MTALHTHTHDLDIADDAVSDAALERLDVPGAPDTLPGVVRVFFRYTSPWVLTLAATGAIAARLVLGWQAGGAGTPSSRRRSSSAGRCRSG